MGEPNGAAVEACHAGFIIHPARGEIGGYVSLPGSGWKLITSVILIDRSRSRDEISWLEILLVG
jgi:hypothetical protein